MIQSVVISSNKKIKEPSLVEVYENPFWIGDSESFTEHRFGMDFRRDSIDKVKYIDQGIERSQDESEKIRWMNPASVHFMKCLLI